MPNASLLSIEILPGGSRPSEYVQVNRSVARNRDSFREKKRALFVEPIPRKRDTRETRGLSRGKNAVPWKALRKRAGMKNANNLPRAVRESRFARDSPVRRDFTARNRAESRLDCAGSGRKPFTGNSAHAAYTFR
jgi:hypothetical protein